MKKKLFITVLCVAIACLTLGIGAVTYAWLTDTDTATQTYTMGDIEYTINQPIANGVVVPGQNLLDSTDGIELLNKSTVKSNIRVKTTVSVTKVGSTAEAWTIDSTTLEAGKAVTTGKEAQMLLVSGTGWAKEGDYWYYGSSITPTEIAASADTANGVAIPQLGSFFTVNGAKVGNAYAGATITVTFTFEAKQAEYVTWAELGSISFSTGLTA